MWIACFICRNKLGVFSRLVSYESSVHTRNKQKYLKYNHGLFSEVQRSHVKFRSHMKEVPVFLNCQLLESLPCLYGELPFFFLER